MNRRGFIGAMVGAGVAIRTKAMELFKWPKSVPGDCTYPLRPEDFRIRWFDRQGNPMEMMEAAERMGDNGYKRVALTILPNYRYVSTVWLGLEHAMWPKPYPQQIFETMAFEEERRFSPPSQFFDKGFYYHEEVGCERYATEAEALAGHQRMCERICPGSLTLGWKEEAKPPRREDEVPKIERETTQLCAEVPKE